MRSEEGEGEKIALVMTRPKARSMLQNVDPHIKWLTYAHIVEDYADCQWPIIIKVKSSVTTKDLVEALEEFLTTLKIQVPSQTFYDTVLAFEAEPGKEGD